MIQPKGPSFINVQLVQILISNGVIMSRYFMQRLLKHFGRYDADLINLKVQHHFSQFNLEHLQQRLRTSWGSNLSSETFTMLLIEGFKNFGNETPVQGNDMELFHFLSGGPFFINHAPAKLNASIQKIEELIKKYHFIPFPRRPKQRLADFEDENANARDSYAVEAEYPSKDGFENLKQMNVIARAILIHLPLVQLWKDQGYTEICHELNELVMQGALLILFPPTTPSDWKIPNIQNVVERLQELKGIGFQLTDAVIGDALFLFENRLKEFGDIFMEAFQKVRGESKNILARRCFYEITKRERQIKSTSLLDFLFQHIDQDQKQQCVEHAMLHHGVGPSRIEVDGKKNIITLPTKKIKRLRLSYIVYEWVLAKLRPEAMATSLCFYDILRARIELGRNEGLKNPQNRQSQPNQSASTRKSENEHIRDLFKIYRKKKVPFQNIHVSLLTTIENVDDETLMMYDDVYQKKKWKTMIDKLRSGEGSFIDDEDRDYQGVPTTYKMNLSR